MSRWKKGQSGNPNGRPKGARGKSNPHTKLRQALENGLDLKSLKRLAADLIQDKETNMSPAQIKDILKLLFETEIELLKLDFKHSDDPEVDFEDDDDDFAVEIEVRTTASDK